MKAETNLQRRLAQGEFAVTCEFNPPCGVDVDLMRDHAAKLQGKVDAVSVNDNFNARVTMSSWALSKILLDMGIEPILEMVTRDRNRIALQSDLLGAAALGIHNVLCFTGDHPARGDHPEAKSVFDIDAIQWIAAVKEIAGQGRLMSGKEISGTPKFFVGALANPFVQSLELHIIRLEKKIAAGAEFIQTQPVLDMARFKAWLGQAAGRGLVDQCPVIAGVIALRSVAMAQELNRNVPGIVVPDAILDRLGGVPEEQQEEEGIKICVEKIQELRETMGVKGVHLMAPAWEERLPEIIGQVSPLR
ncbi:MAG: methylenetetrahydrofolate reductase [Thermodesulfobacteriota bacterium]|nr:methylenetetrahydrofolate reductase [Thermodesulfobacteriota bacterium]